MLPHQHGMLVFIFALAVTLTQTAGVAAGAGKAPAPAGAEPGVDVAAVRLAIADLADTFGERYAKGKEYLSRLEAIEKLPAGAEREAALRQLQREALLANPLLTFEKLLVVKRPIKAPHLGLPANYNGNTDLPKNGFDDEIAAVTVRQLDANLQTVYKPGGKFVGDLDLHWDARRLLFSMPAAGGRWQVHELRLDGGGTGAAAPRVVQVTPGDQADVDNYDACYLPDASGAAGRVIFTSTACVAGVPCVGGASHVANLYSLDRGSGRARQLTFDQDHNWCPTVLADGRVLYLRWEYCDLPHAFSRILFHMNPDGTGQAEYYGSNSYWPNGVFYARPLSGSSTKFVGIVTGHHGVARMGELVVFDRSVSSFEAGGAVQRIPGRGKKVQAVLLDQLADASWPKFLHPWPLSQKHFLVAAQLRGGEPWGIYLADVFDNMVLVAREQGFALLEPTPLAPRPAPPAIRDRVEPSRADAVVYMTDVYRGGGLAGVPRGTIKRLRLLSYHYSYWGMGGQTSRVGLDGPWDVKRIVGTVPVAADGSAVFRVPANVPIAVQPLDANGQAVQLMRSWFTAMPGENVTCVGCHERQHDASPAAAALGRKPSEIEPWYGPMRGFSFVREVQPVLDRHCVGCHDGKAGGGSTALTASGTTALTANGTTALTANGTTALTASGTTALAARPDFTPRAEVQMKYGFHCPPSYYALRRYVRGPTMEGDMHMLPPWDFHAESTRLVQMLRKGHHGVNLDGEAWDRLATWIDLNTPTHGTWGQIVGQAKVATVSERRRALKKLYAGLDDDPEAIVPTTGEYGKAQTFVAPPPDERVPGTQVPGLRDGNGTSTVKVETEKRVIDLGEGVKLTLARVPEGEFVMGSNAGHRDERPAHRVKIDKAFWIGATEITNAQYRRFDPAHDSRIEHGHFLHFSERERGYTLNEPNQPVLRVTWRDAMAFCRWLGERSKLACTLPTEAQWEYACRAGTRTEMNYGGCDTDHAAHANLADATINRIETLGWGLPSGAIPPWHPTDGRFDDKARVSTAVGSYRPNAWGLYDMHGNVAEWTRSSYAAYGRLPSGDGPGTDAMRMVVRGGSWYDRPKEATSSFRRSHLPYQQAYDVGFRVVIEEEGPSQPRASLR